MTRDEQFIIENAAADDDLDLLLATHRCAVCAADAFLEADGEWFCVECIESVDHEQVTTDVPRAA
ncbi:hypothetical protein ACX9R5_07275 [Rathayibacter sp. CAU 1779]